MGNVMACFASTRYWQNETELNAAFGEIKNELNTLLTDCRLISGGTTPDKLKGQAGDALVIMPMSGAVQKDILTAAARFDTVILYAGYVSGNVGSSLAEALLKNNAAPTLMDSWAVLRKTHPRAMIALDREELTLSLRLAEAYKNMLGKKILLIGQTEPWVISVSRDFDVYAKMGITVEQVDETEVAKTYEKTTEEESRFYYEKYTEGASACIEPEDVDLKNAARMTCALLKVLEAHQADGLAIACFNLLSLGTTSCLGVSYINDSTDKVAACEGDLDSAVTMLMLKQLTKTSVWMANPGLHPDGVINFSHCTAPIKADGKSDSSFILRNHHESGIGVSLEVQLPSDIRMTACRVSGLWGSYTAQGAMGELGLRESCCRTQLYVRFDDFERYIKTALGCHQIFCFEEVTEDFRKLAQWLGLKEETSSI